jgi:hypothetical protein
MLSVQTALFVYLAGVAVGLWRTDDRPAVRALMAVSWPIGVLAFVVTLSVVFAASVVAFPAVGATVVAGAALAWWLFT